MCNSLLNSSAADLVGGGTSLLLQDGHGDGEGDCGGARSGPGCCLCLPCEREATGFPCGGFSSGLLLSRQPRIFLPAGELPFAGGGILVCHGSEDVGRCSSTRFFVYESSSACWLCLVVCFYCGRSTSASSAFPGRTMASIHLCKFEPTERRRAKEEGDDSGCVLAYHVIQGVFLQSCRDVLFHHLIQFSLSQKSALPRSAAACLLPQQIASPPQLL
jgi:hypothetical protein